MNGHLPGGFSLLVLQHHPAEHLGRFAPLLSEDSAHVRTVSLDQGEELPGLDGIDGVWALGGPMQVWQEGEFPWLADEKALIRDAVVERRLPFLGLCLGHQLLAESLGGAVGIAETPEVGVLPVTLTDAGQASGLFDGLERELMCIQGHGAQVSQLPPGADVLAASPDCAIQAIAFGRKAFGLQFHSELTLDMIDACLKIDAYKADFEAMLGEQGIARFREEVSNRSDYFDRVAERLYRNWARCAVA